MKTILIGALFMISISANAGLYFAPDPTLPVTVRYEVENELDSANAILARVDKTNLFNDLHLAKEFAYSGEFEMAPGSKTCSEASFTISTSASYSKQTFKLDSQKTFTLSFSLWQNGNRFALEKEQLDYSINLLDFAICWR